MTTRLCWSMAIDQAQPMKLAMLHNVSNNALHNVTANVQHTLSTQCSKSTHQAFPLTTSCVADCLTQLLRKQSAENNFEVALQRSNATLCSIRKTEQEKLGADLLDVEFQGSKTGPSAFPLYGRNAGILQILVCSSGTSEGPGGCAFVQLSSRYLQLVKDSVPLSPEDCCRCWEDALLQR